MKENLIYYVSEDLKAPLQLPGEFPGWGGERPEPGTQAFQDHIRPRAETGKMLKWGKRLVEQKEIPSICRLLKRRKNLPGAFRTSNGILIAQDLVRKIIEELDPGIHQFLPVEIQQPCERYLNCDSYSFRG